jgi:hypothetical protein
MSLHHTLGRLLRDGLLKHCASAKARSIRVHQLLACSHPENTRLPLKTCYHRNNDGPIAIVWLVNRNGTMFVSERDRGARARCDVFDRVAVIDDCRFGGFRRSRVVLCDTLLVLT